MRKVSRVADKVWGSALEDKCKSKAVTINLIFLRGYLELVGHVQGYLA